MHQHSSLQTDAPWQSESNLALACWLVSSHRAAFSRNLVPGILGVEPHRNPRLTAQELMMAPAVVLAHDDRPLDQEDGPRLIYANQAALRLWRYSWNRMIGMPSKLTAEPELRASRQAALASAQQRTAISDYAGIRIDSQGSRFAIEGARIWTLVNPQGQTCGQAAAFSSWWRLSPN